MRNLTSNRKFLQSLTVQFLLCTLFLPPIALAQFIKDGEIQTAGPVPLLRVSVVERSTKAVNYHYRSGATKVNFAGTTLQPAAHGEAKVESKKGYIEIEVEFEKLAPARKYGSEFLTYVLWAITPEGRANNLGELLLNRKGEGKLDVSTELQAFGMIVTAEPYFAVTHPSDVVVMENVIRPDTKGNVEEINAKYELLPRGIYVFNVDTSKMRSIFVNSRVPLDLLEARNAVRMARWRGANQDAAEIFEKAEGLLDRAEAFEARHAGKKYVIMTAREATQTAEDARLIAVKRQEDREVAALRETALTLAIDEARFRTEDDGDRVAAEQARQDAETAAAIVLDEKREAEEEANMVGLDANQAEQEELKAEYDRLELRSLLADQLNMILETHDSARGLIVNLSDILFDTGQYRLRPTAREKLSKIAWIVLAHPGLNLEIEGYADSQGSEGFNQRLSEERALAVRGYLIRQGVPPISIAARGFGDRQPVVSNSSPAGRQQNRVELVISGIPIGS